MYLHGHIIIVAPDDFTSTVGSLSISESATLECVNISITSDSDDEQDMECFAFAISTASTSDEYSLDNTQATICITDDDGKLCTKFMYKRALIPCV